MMFATSVPPAAIVSCIHEARDLTTELRNLIDSLQCYVPQATPVRALRLSQVLIQSGDSKSGIYQKIKEGKFPAPFHVGRSSRWWQHEIDACLRARATKDGRWNRGENGPGAGPQKAVIHQFDPSLTKAPLSRLFEIGDRPESTDDEGEGV